MNRPFRRYVRYPLEAAAAWIGLKLFGLLPLDAASAIGGWLGRTIGPRLPVTRLGIRNIALAMPETSPDETKRIIRGMWDNLGRTVAEYPHLEHITGVKGKGRTEIVGLEHIASINDEAGGGIVISGHFANFEVFALTARLVGIPTAQVFRSANNPIVERMVRRARCLPEDLIIPKSAAGARMMVSILKRGRRFGLAVDQKLNDGIAAPFFGYDAMTPPSAAQLALRFGRPILPVSVERLGGCRFRITVHPPIVPELTDDRKADVYDLTVRINRFVEDVVRKRPDNWLWVHRRWPDQAKARPSASSASDRPAAPDPAASRTD